MKCNYLDCCTSTDVALHAAIEEMDKEYEEERKRMRDYSLSSSDIDSFVSAQSVSY